MILLRRDTNLFTDVICKIERDVRMVHQMDQMEDSRRSCMLGEVGSAGSTILLNGKSPQKRRKGLKRV